jgi:hypothetical protein
MTEEQRTNVLKLVKAMAAVGDGEAKTDVCNAALHLGVTVAVLGGATEEMVVAAVRELCGKLHAERSN